MDARWRIWAGLVIEVNCAQGYIQGYIRQRPSLAHAPGAIGTARACQ